MTHAQGEILETPQTNITRTDIEIAFDSLQSLTSVRQTLFSYLSNQKVLGKEKESLEHTIENLKDEKRQLELDVDELKGKLNDMNIEYGMKQKELLKWSNTNETPYIPPSSPVLAPNDSKQVLDKSAHESNNASRQKQTAPEKFTKFAEEINKDRPLTPPHTENLMLNNNGYVPGKVTPCLYLDPFDEITHNLESSIEKENEESSLSKEVEETDKDLTPSPRFSFKEDVAHNKNERGLSKATLCLDILPRDPIAQNLESSFEKEPEVLTCSKEVGETNNPSTLPTRTPTEDAEQNNDEHMLDKATTSSGLLPCDNTKQSVSDPIAVEEQSGQSNCPDEERETDRYPTPSSPSTFTSTEDIAQNNDEQVLKKATTSSDLLPCNNTKQSLLQSEEETEVANCSKEAPSTFTPTEIDDQMSNKADICDVEKENEESTHPKEEKETHKDKASAPSPTTSPSEKLIKSKDDSGLDLSRCDDTIQTELGSTSVEEENEELFCPEDTVDNAFSLLTQTTTAAAEEEEKKGERNKEKVGTVVDNSSAKHNIVRNVDSMSSEDTEDTVPFLTQVSVATAASTEGNIEESKEKISLAHDNAGRNASSMSTEGKDDTVPFLTQVSAASSNANASASAIEIETETEENNGEGENKEKFGTMIDSPLTYNNTEPNENSISTEEDPSLRCEEEEELNMHRWEEPSTESNVITPISKKRRYSYANHWSPKKWRRMIRNHRLQSIFLDNIDR